MTQPQPDTSCFQADWNSIANLHRYSHNAMAATFEIIILHHDSPYARQTALAAFDELDRLEAELSRFIENSDIARINNLPIDQPLCISLDTFHCLQISKQIHDQTNGAFDITVGQTPTGLDHLKLNHTDYSISKTAPIKIDLGGIGKGYAVDKIANLLDDWNIDTALIHGGYSSVYAIGNPALHPQQKGWPLTLSNPANRQQILNHLYLHNRAIAASGLQKTDHIINPYTSSAVDDKLTAWASAPSAAIADALSTAFIVMPPDQVQQYCLTNPDIQGMVITK